jgi:uncharacterized protein with GYD domain
MPKFLIETSLTAEGVAGVRSEGGTAREEAVRRAVESLGGRLEGFYFAFGERDAFVIADFPDHRAAVALSLAVNASGAVTSRMTLLLTSEDVDAAARSKVDFRAPGA